MYAIHYIILVDIAIREAGDGDEELQFQKYNFLRQSRASEVSATSSIVQFRKHAEQLNQIKSKLPELKNAGAWKDFAAGMFSTRDMFNLPERYWSRTSHSKEARSRIIIRLWPWIHALKSSSVQFGWRYALFMDALVVYLFLDMVHFHSFD